MPMNSCYIVVRILHEGLIMWSVNRLPKMALLWSFNRLPKMGLPCLTYMSALSLASVPDDFRAFNFLFILSYALQNSASILITFSLVLNQSRDHLITLLRNKCAGKRKF